jgi:hypothetical protein
MPDAVSADRDQVPVDLALQGGGAHGAFTWGVLDRLLEQPQLRIEGISGTSAGATGAMRRRSLKAPGARSRISGAALRAPPRSARFGEAPWIS